MNELKNAIEMLEDYMKMKAETFLLNENDYTLKYDSGLELADKIENECNFYHIFCDCYDRAERIRNRYFKLQNKELLHIENIKNEEKKEFFEKALKTHRYLLSLLDS